jgi:hypothetical protein
MCILCAGYYKITIKISAENILHVNNEFSSEVNTDETKYIDSKPQSAVIIKLKIMNHV